MYMAMSGGLLCSQHYSHVTPHDTADLAPRFPCPTKARQCDEGWRE